MSNRRRPRAPRVDIEQLATVTRAMATAEGCTCVDVDIHWPKHPRNGEVAMPKVLHDEGCPLEDAGLSKRPALVFLPKRER